MAVPSFVGAGSPIYTAPFDPAASFTVTTGDLPATIQSNDLLFICVLNTGTGSALNPNNAYLSTDLTNAGYNSGGVRQGATLTVFQLFLGFYDPSDFPVTLTRNPLSLVPTAARIETIAYRFVASVPTFSLPNVVTAGASASQTTLPTTTDKQASHVGGRATQLTFQNSGNISAVVNARSTTERHRQTGITGFGGGLVVADTTVSGEDFVTYTHNLTGGAVLSVGMNPDGAPEPFTPGPRGLGGWGVGETKDEQW